MQVIPALPTITSVPHIFETPDDIIINGQIYDKNTMKPKPYCFFNFTNVLDKYNLLNQSIDRIGYKVSISDKGIDYEYIIQDSEDSSIFYIPYFNSGNAVTKCLAKIQKQDNTYKILKTNYYNSPYTNYNQENMFKFLCQTKDYILLSESHYAWDAWGDLRNICIRRVSKNDLSSTYIIHYGNNSDPYGSGADSGCFATSHYILKYNNSYAYIYAHYGDGNHIYKYNILNNTIVNLKSFGSNFVNNYDIGVSNVLSLNDKYYIFTGNTTHDSYCMHEITIDSDDNVFLKEYNLSHPNFEFNHKGFRTMNGTSHAIASYLVYTLKLLNENYIGLTIHQNEGAAPITTHHKHILIKYDENKNDFKITDCIDIDNCYGVLYYDKNTSVILIQNGYQFYINKNGKWNKVYEESGTFNYIGFDTYKRFYSIDNSNIVKIQSNITTTVLNLAFEQSSYKYNGTIINTTCIFSAKNFLNEFVNAKVKITLTGPIEFDNGLKTLITRTDNIEQIKNVRIIGSGNIGANIIEMEE